MNQINQTEFYEYQRLAMWAFLFSWNDSKFLIET